ncbi:MAG: hypothetical protein DYG89_15275 [Caldilinea sp. CFX5]|nr:hypothetical protein [Caldilinea sp. CFX5]
MTLQERKQNLLNQRRQMIDQKEALKQSLSEINRGIQRVEGALLLVQEMEVEQAPPVAPAAPVSQETASSCGRLADSFKGNQKEPNAKIV